MSVWNLSEVKLFKTIVSFLIQQHFAIQKNFFFLLGMDIKWVSIKPSTIFVVLKNQNYKLLKIWPVLKTFTELIK